MQFSNCFSCLKEQIKKKKKKKLIVLLSSIVTLVATLKIKSSTSPNHENCLFELIGLLIRNEELLQNCFQV